MKEEQIKNIVREIQSRFCGKSVEDKLLNAIKETYDFTHKEVEHKHQISLECARKSHFELGQESIIKKVDKIFKGYSLMSEPTWKKIRSASLSPKANIEKEVKKE